MNNYIQRIEIPINFPNGVRIGEGQGHGNILKVARDGSNEFILRGSAVAGAVRHALKDSSAISDSELVLWFGSDRASDRPRDSELNASRIKLADSKMRVGASSKQGIRIRNHSAIDRHRGAPIDGGLFSMESLPPETKTTLIITLESRGEEADRSKEVLQSIVELFDQGIGLGGSVARGIGLAFLEGKALWKGWDLSDVDQHADWLDEIYQIKRSRRGFSGKPLATKKTDSSILKIRLKLAIPRGQDLLIADGHGIESDTEPQTITMPNGEMRWLLPGSTLRGLFRAYITRLAARDGKAVADSHARYRDRNQNPSKITALTGDDIAYGFASKEDRLAYYEHPLSVSCPVMKLFGSAYARGRIHIADALSVGFTKTAAQSRMHVAIDRFSGGANEGFLFENQTLTSGNFELLITLKNPSEDEAKWVAQAIRALDMGLIRVGSSKSAGRLSLIAPPDAKGPFANSICEIRPIGVYRG